MSRRLSRRPSLVGDGAADWERAMGQGLDEDGLARFAAVAASHVGDDTVPGLVALVAHGDDVHVEAPRPPAVGGRPVDGGSLFRIASTTKPITAAATLALVREG